LLLLQEGQDVLLQQRGELLDLQALLLVDLVRQIYEFVKVFVVCGFLAVLVLDGLELKLLALRQVHGLALLAYLEELDQVYDPELQDLLALSQVNYEALKDALVADLSRVERVEPELDLLKGLLELLLVGQQRYLRLELS